MFRGYFIWCIKGLEIWKLLLIFDLMENKEYYTPDLEDFFIGYEYERCDKIGEWYKCKAQLYGLSDIQTLKNQTDLYNKYGKEGFEAMVEKQKKDKKDFLLYSERLRTPYLCKESIEELGWEYTGKSIDIWFKKEGVFDMGNFTAYKIVMHYGLEDHRMFIYAEDQGSEYDLFKGVVKSKNELKKLMKDYLNIPI